MNNFNEFAKVCKEIAKNLNTMVEVTNYWEYGWGQVAFMTDPFGGTYMCLHYDMKTGQVTNWYGTKDERRVNDIPGLSYYVKDEMKKMLKARNLEKVSELINAEY